MMKWLRKQIKEERRTLVRARRRFLHNPSEESLHHVRTSSRRLRSLLEDSGDIVSEPALLRAVKRTAKSTDPARDAAVIRALLERVVAPAERTHAAELLRDLRLQEELAMRRACKKLARVSYD
ncbi:MAG: CHAD domain-containing protein [Candidatus Eremiobacteraeota bacterium]|nr:CHAD domain-containing protein [Candidatus Eremiobacteraeota bacterium]MBV9700778.1 CHAD domain-containing protein [Candidatus Eremiobacteraeota bacterium]